MEDELNKLSNGIEYGLATKEDAEQIFSLFKKNTEDNIKNPDKGFLMASTSMIERRKKMFLEGERPHIVARKNGEIIGFRGYYIMDEESKEQEIHNKKHFTDIAKKPLKDIKICRAGPVCVDSKYQGQKVMTGLKNEFMNKIKSENPDFLYTSIVTESAKGWRNEASEKASEKLGFYNIGEVEQGRNKEGEIPYKETGERKEGERHMKWGERAFQMDKKTEIANALKKEKTEEINTLHTPQEERNEELIIKPHQEHERKFREGIHVWIKNIKGKEFPGLGIVKRFHVIRGGETAVLCKLEIVDKNREEKIYVIKTCYKKHKIEIEQEASKRRRQEGANVIEILSQGTMDVNNEQYPYIILPYVQENLEWNSLTREEKQEIAKQWGENLALMHKVKGTGFGIVKDTENLIGTDDKFKFQESIVGVKIRDVLIKAGFFQEEELNSLIQKSCDIINKDCEKGEKPSLIHHDVSINNTFIKKSPNIETTFYDLDAELDHPMHDLALGMLRGTIGNYHNETQNETQIENEKNALIEGYKSKGGRYNENIVNVYLFLICIRRGARAYHKATTIYPEGAERKNLLGRTNSFVTAAKKMAEEIKKINM